MSSSSSLVVVVEYAELPAVFDSEEALEPNAPILHPDATMEDLIIKDGRALTANLGDYKLPTQLAVPPFRTVLIPTDIGPGPFGGAKAAGETVNNAVAPAVVNANLGRDRGPANRHSGHRGARSRSAAEQTTAA